MSSKALGSGSLEPPMQEGQLRLYGMRFCPYTERVRLVLTAKQAPFDMVNINLSDKPDWYTKKYGSKVPILALGNARVLHESTVICNYLDETYRQNPLYGDCPYHKAKNLIQIEMLRDMPSMCKLLKNPSTAKADLQALHASLHKFEDELAYGHKKFFRGDEVGMPDYMMWPFFYRFKVFPKLAKLDPELYRDFTDSTVPFSHITGWMGRMADDEAVKACAVDIDTLAKFMIGYQKGHPDYDIGLTE